MLHILNFVPDNSDVDYVLEDDVELYHVDWNGECYRDGFDPSTSLCTGYSYYPIYREFDDSEGDFEIIGFERRF